MNAVEVSAIAGAVATLVGALIALRRMRPDRDHLIITSAQGATTILNDLVKTLYAEIDRLRTREASLEAEIHKLEGQLQSSHREAEGLRHRHGTRRDDGVA